MAVARQIMNADEIPDDDSLEELVTAALDELSENYMGGLFISTGCEEYRMSRIREICASAAKAMDLDFIEVGPEEYDFALRKRDFDDYLVRRLSALSRRMNSDPVSMRWVDTAARIRAGS